MEYNCIISYAAEYDILYSYGHSQHQSALLMSLSLPSHQEVVKLNGHTGQTCRLSPLKSLS